MKMGVKYFCDRCGKTIPSMSREIYLRILDPDVWPASSRPKEYVICVKCKNKFKKWLKADIARGDNGA